ncbi:MAG TPA: hypothetical protein VIV11_37335 [Kofleriaceae bacterium]
MERELQAEREKTAREREKTARVEAELAFERTKRKRVQANLGASPPEPYPVVDEPRRPRIPLWRDPADESRSDVVGVVLTLVIFFALGLFALALAYA